MSTHEQWDIVSSVGITALAVAESRAVESRRADRLIDDPYAHDLVEAADSATLAALRGHDEAQESDYVGVRTRFFDEYLLRAAAGGARQAVILASGLDTRAFRLDWPAGVRVFEIDQPKVLEFKDETLNELGAAATAERHAIPVDLRDDWASALKNAGFDPGLPTAWLAEGLLPYLPPDAEAQLLSTMHQFSAPGSRICIEHIAGARDQLATEEMRELAEQAGLDLDSWFNTEDRPDPGAELSELGWTVHRDPTAEITAAYGRQLTGINARFHEHGQMLTAHLEG